VAALVLAACRTAPPSVSDRLPDPLSPPAAGTPLTAAETKAARAAFAAMSSGDLERAGKRLARLPAAHPVRRLIALEGRLASGERVADEALALAGDEESYAAAWAFATMALRAEGRTAGALTAARRALELRADRRNSEAAAALEGEVVATGVGESRAMLARGDPTGALERARAVLELVPAAEEARLLAVRAALASGQTSRAAEMLPALSDSPAALEAKGNVAEALGQWELAATFYEQLPESFARRCELLAGAREQMRLSLAPPYLSEALGELPVTRRGLAAILVWEVPGLAEKARGPVPVFEDVVALPEGRDILVAVRAGTLAGDSIARRFHPNRPVGERELIGCLERLARTVGAPPPRWCDAGAAAECLPRPATLDGRTVAHLVRSVSGQEEGPCTRP